ncbi:hypothetical protein SKAU_G00360460 [Synaphobranchus kaupii]|uniref:Uncharacterized protein n=1 Tax=Synaphobranchus kaupii TaxID=118154 RepID=A0A9Q1EI91_SYNKA|nr:hypothetical protein SKAU_G00360460 [Synaphobranchus kaupii]
MDVSDDPPQNMQFAFPPLYGLYGAYHALRQATRKLYSPPASCTRSSCLLADKCAAVAMAKNLNPVDA